MQTHLVVYPFLVLLLPPITVRHAALRPGLRVRKRGHSGNHHESAACRRIACKHLITTNTTNINHSCRVLCDCRVLCVTWLQVAGIGTVLPLMMYITYQV